MTLHDEVSGFRTDLTEYLTTRKVGNVAFVPRLNARRKIRRSTPALGVQNSSPSRGLFLDLGRLAATTSTKIHDLGLWPGAGGWTHLFMTFLLVFSPEGRERLSRAGIGNVVRDHGKTDRRYFGVQTFVRDGPEEPMTMTMTMTHSKRSIRQSLVAWPHRRERRGHDPVITVCSTSDHKEKHMGKRNTGCCWYKFSEFNSLESSDSVQRNEWGQGMDQRNQSKMLWSRLARPRWKSTVAM